MTPVHKMNLKALESDTLCLPREERDMLIKIIEEIRELLKGIERVGNSENISERFALNEIQDSCKAVIEYYAFCRNIIESSKR